MKKTFLFILIAVFLFFSIFSIVNIFQQKQILNQNVSIPRGASLQNIAKILAESKVIDSPTLFLIISKLFYHRKSISYGQFDFTGKYNLPEVIAKLSKADIVAYTITIPEGFTVRNIAEVLTKKNMIDFNKFISLTQDTLFIKQLGLKLNNLEGFLFPDTYYIPYYAKEKDIIKMMLDNFFGQWDKIQNSNLNSDSLYSVLILASIIQSESCFEDEMPIIAGVYRNRLQTNMLLQADPTVAYALALHNQKRTKIYFDDLKIRSPYNTYLNRGLPPTPICNPGTAAIESALKPENTDYIFFFAGEDSHHIFSRTYNEHLQKMGRL
ncbi:MAG: endolytic transglycosylase MltG [Candidatus Cloacimonadota bacterium]|nr:endolytic transglycosylase MltG [Candidatus Cloacimonadota bacterium]